MNNITKKIIYLIVSLLYLYLHLTGYFEGVFNNISNYFAYQSDGGILISMLLVLPSMIFGPLGFLFFVFLAFKKEKKTATVNVSEEQRLNTENVNVSTLDGNLATQSTSQPVENKDLININNVETKDELVAKRKGLSPGQIVFILLAVFGIPSLIEYGDKFFKMSNSDQSVTVFLLLGLAFVFLMIFGIPLLIGGSAAALGALFKRRK